MASIEAQYKQWGYPHLTDLITASGGRILAVQVHVANATLSVRVNEKDVEEVRGLMKARGLNIIEQSV